MADSYDPGRPKAPPSTGGDAEKIKSRAGDEVRAASDVVAEAREGAASIASRARDEAAAKGEELKDRTADQLGVFADAVRAASDELAAKEPGMVSDMVGQAARGLEEFSNSLRRTSPGGMVDGVRAFGRQNPVAFLAGTMLAGFAVARFAGSSAAPRRAGFEGGPSGSSYPGRQVRDYRQSAPGTADLADSPPSSAGVRAGSPYPSGDR